MDGIEQRDVARIIGSDLVREHDAVTMEDPLTIELITPEYGTYNLGVTMRTRGEDRSLALGFLYSEGIISSMDNIERIDSEDDVISLTLQRGSKFDPKVHCRPSTVSSACGICGRSTIDDALGMHGCINLDEVSSISLKVIVECLNQIRTSQKIFDLTGGSHACCSFTTDAKMIEIFEDVGRHNAMDKLVGSYFRKRKMPPTEPICILSGRASFELVHKSLLAGFPILVAIGAPSTMAVDLSKEHGQTLICFAKENSLTAYSGVRRISQ